MEEADRLCHRIAIINHGRIAAIDTPDRLKMKSMELQYIEVLFEKPVASEALLKHPDVSRALAEGNKLRIYTANPSDVICFIVDLARRRETRILSLRTMTPSLEDIFMKLIREHKG